MFGTFVPIVKSLFVVMKIKNNYEHACFRKYIHISSQNKKNLFRHKSLGIGDYFVGPSVL